MAEHDEAVKLHSMTRAELEQHAADLGVEEPGGYPNKDALIDAISERHYALVGEAGVEAEAEADPANSERYRVLKAITLADGSTVMPGEEIDLSGPEWPARRAKQLVDQKYLRPL